MFRKLLEIFLPKKCYSPYFESCDCIIKCKYPKPKPIVLICDDNLATIRQKN